MKVLEFSIREHTAFSVQVSDMSSFDRVMPLPREVRNRPRTPFSFQRFLIPELCAYQGRAIYLDADMQLFTDIGALWNAPMGSCDLLTVSEGTQGRKGQYSVVLLDCERLQWRIESIVQGLDDGRYTYEQLMYEMCVAHNVGRTLDPSWNSLEKYVPEEKPDATRLLHYTDMNIQPWISRDNPLAPLWLACLRRAVASGVITEAELDREIAKGHVRPSLRAEAFGRSQTAAQARQLDRAFVPPYKTIRSGQGSPWASWRARVAAYGRGGMRRLRAWTGR
ncbi:glycosyltransferase [Hylemonella sp. W303a]|uniref:glycosyltransferase n=1 Tax=Hylemonella sp. W303a TaxID=3389873 RepID=UPI00396B4235